MCIRDRLGAGHQYLPYDKQWNPYDQTGVLEKAETHNCVSKVLFLINLVVCLKYNTLILHKTPLDKIFILLLNYFPKNYLNWISELELIQEMLRVRLQQTLNFQLENRGKDQRRRELKRCNRTLVFTIKTTIRNNNSVSNVTKNNFFATVGFTR